MSNSPTDDLKLVLHAKIYTLMSSRQRSYRKTHLPQIKDIHTHVLSATQLSQIQRARERRPRRLERCPYLLTTYALVPSSTALTFVRRRSVGTISTRVHPLGLPRLDTLVLMKAERGRLEPKHVQRQVLSRNPMTDETSRSSPISSTCSPRL